MDEDAPKQQRKPQDWWNHRPEVNRRQFLKYMGIGGLALAGGSLPYSEAFGQDTRRLHLWASGTQTIEENWSKLERDLGIRIVFSDNGNATGPVINKMVFGDAEYTYDVSGLQGGAEQEMADQGVILPWDMSQIPNWDDEVWPWVQDIPYHMVDGERYGIPLTVNADSMIYDADKLPEVDTYAYVFDDSLKGKTAMEDWWANSVLFTAIYLKENNIKGMGSIDDPGNLEKDELEGVMEFLIKQKKEGQFRTFWSGWEQGVSLVTSGEVWCMTGWEPIVKAAQEKGINAKYAVPKEGYEGWSNDLLLHKGVRQKGLYETAHQFVNWIYSGYYGNVIQEMRGYANPTNRVVQYAEKHPDEFDPEWIKAKQQHVKDKFFEMKGETYWQNVRPDNFKLYEEWWEKLRRA